MCKSLNDNISIFVQHVSNKFNEKIQYSDEPYTIAMPNDEAKLVSSGKGSKPTLSKVFLRVMNFTFTKKKQYSGRITIQISYSRIQLGFFFFFFLSRKVFRLFFF